MSHDNSPLDKSASNAEVEKLRKKVDKLKKINLSLMNRVEQITDEQGEAVSIFQNAITLERQVKERTASLESARDNLVKTNAALRIAKEEAESAMLARSRFFANMSHELRTPMNGILGILQLVLDGEVAPAVRSDLEIVQSSATSMLGMVNDILDFSKLDTDKLELESQQLEPGLVIEEAVSLFLDAGTQKGLVLYTVLGPGVPRTVLGDLGRIRQILKSLVGNAIKFTERGSIGVEVCIESESQADWVLRWDVVDTGIGLSSGQVDSLFQPFSQADNSSTRKHGGTGLGLAISACLARAMGGDIGVKGSLGQGSRFWFSARLRKPEVAAPALPVLDKPLQVLLAVGCEGTQLSLQSLLLSIGAKWILASSHVKGTFDFAIVDQQIDSELACLAKNNSQRCLQVIDHRAGPSIANDPSLRQPVRRAALLNALQAPVGLAPAAVAPKKKVAALENCEALRVLVVEDNKINQKVTLRSLKRLGIIAELAENGLLAVEAHEQQAFDLIFMDCQMPVMDGYEATRTIRKQYAGNSPVPIVAMTANALSGDRELCLGAGMSDYMTKPVSLEMLRDAVVRWMPSKKNA